MIETLERVEAKLDALLGALTDAVAQTEREKIRAKARQAIKAYRGH